MSESKHTPAPWQLLKSNPDRDGADCWTLLAQPHPSLRGFTLELGIIAGPCADAKAAANARLIATAPDLLEALTELVGMYRGVCSNLGFGVTSNRETERDLAKSLAAIAKATGAA